MRQPFALFLTMPRILYEAWVLHFSRRLDVFPRPEPQAVVIQPQSARAAETVPGGGVGWQSEGILESYTRKLVIHFLKCRAHETGISIFLIPSNPNIAPVKILAAEKVADAKTLEIFYSSSRFFIILFACPSSEHAILLGSSTEGIFQVSSSDLFTMVFRSDTHDPQPSFLQAMLQRFRRSRVPQTLKVTKPSVHCLDLDCSVTRLVTSTLVLCCLTLLDCIEKTVFHLTGSRFVQGEEPWNAWKRAAEINSNGGNHSSGKAHTLSFAHGSVRRDS